MSCQFNIFATELGLIKEILQISKEIINSQLQLSQCERD